MSTAADLRTLVIRRAGARRKVALLSSDEAIKAGLEANGCTVLADPESLDVLSGFDPDVVVAFDGLTSQAPGADAFAALVKAAPRAELLFSFANAASATNVVQSLTGQAPLPGLPEPQVREWLRIAGLEVAERDVVVMPHQRTSLSADAEASLRALCEQVNPLAVADRLLVVARRGVTVSPPEPVPGRLSVVVAATGDLVALDRTVFSLAAQPHGPLELVVTGDAEAVVAPIVERHRGLGRYQPVYARDGLAAATGQYVSLLQAGDVVYPHHFTKLIAALERGTAAWAVARSRRAIGRPYVERKTEPTQEARFSAVRWLQHGAVERCAFVVDRTRLGPFVFAYPAEAPAAEAVLFARLCGVFPPAFVPGLATVERPVDDAVPSTAGLLDALKGRPLRLLLSLEEVLLDEQKPARVELVERLNDELKRRAPKVHSGLKQLAQRWQK